MRQMYTINYQIILLSDFFQNIFRRKNLCKIRQKLNHKYRFFLQIFQNFTRICYFRRVTEKKIYIFIFFRVKSTSATLNLFKTNSSECCASFQTKSCFFFEICESSRLSPLLKTILRLQKNEREIFIKITKNCNKINLLVTSW